MPAILGNAYLATFVQFSFLLFFPWWACGLVLSASRYVFAFSFDRILPSTFADINARLHIPIKATILTLIVGAVLVYFTAYTSYIGQVLNTTTIWAIVWIIVGISAIVFPIRRKDLAKGLPGGPRALQIFGFLSVVAMAITLYFARHDAGDWPCDPCCRCPFGDHLRVRHASSTLLRYYYFKGKGINLGAVLQRFRRSKLSEPILPASAARPRPSMAQRLKGKVAIVTGA